MANSLSNGTALITGASRGIGAVYADRLAKRGYDLILVARDEARLKTLSVRLASETGRSITPLPADLNHKTDLAKVESVLRDDRTITMLVNNAGIASVAPLLDADVEKMDEMIALNITALTRLIYAAGMDLEKTEATPIGVNCRLCERENCPQRAEPPLTRTWLLDENTRRTTAFVFSNAREL